MDALENLLIELDRKNLSPKERDKIIYKIGGLNDSRAVDALHKMLIAPNVSIKEIGAYAMALGEAKANIAVPDIVKYLHMPEYEGARAELLVSLYDLDCAEYYLTFLEIMCSADFEASEIAVILAIDLIPQIDMATRTEALKILDNYTNMYTNVNSKDPNSDENHKLKIMKDVRMALNKIHE